MSLLKEKAVVMVWVTWEVVGHSTLHRLACAEQEALDFSLVLTALGLARLRPLFGVVSRVCPKCFE